MRAPLKLDQLYVFVAVEEHGSFSAAARALGRAQSAVTYAIQELEADLRIELFDRTGYRPTLSSAGRALLARARRILREASAFQNQADSVAGGVEPALSLVIDAMFPMPPLAKILRAFAATFPMVATNVFVTSLGSTPDRVLDRSADLGLVNDAFAVSRDLELRNAAMVEIAYVCSPEHPLAALRSSETNLIAAEEMEKHLQLILSDHSERTKHQDYGVWSPLKWRFADLGARHAMILAGLGWGGMPLHLVDQDLKSGRLTRLFFVKLAPTPPVDLPFSVAKRVDRVFGPAAAWLFDQLSLGCAEQHTQKSRLTPNSSVADQLGLD